MRAVRLLLIGRLPKSNSSLFPNQYLPFLRSGPGLPLPRRVGRLDQRFLLM